jgi:hypothetical protein
MCNRDPWLKSSPRASGTVSGRQSMADAVEAAAVDELLQAVGRERDDAKQQVYLVTFSRILAATLAADPALRDPTILSRDQIGAALQDSLDDPLPAGAGRPRSNQGGVVVRYVVFRETHADDTYHFHVAVKLTSSQRFAAAKRTLQHRHGLVSNWSCSHTLFWSAVRYGHVVSESKPVVDIEPFQWAADGQMWDIFETSQEPYRADGWRLRREKRDLEAESSGASASFTKLDLHSLVLSKNLRTKRKLLTYVQTHGTVAMQAFATKHQRRLAEFIDDALEWESLGLALVAVYAVAFFMQVMSVCFPCRISVLR